MLKSGLLLELAQNVTAKNAKALQRILGLLIFTGDLLPITRRELLICVRC